MLSESASYVCDRCCVVLQYDEYEHYKAFWTSYSSIGCSFSHARSLLGAHDVFGAFALSRSVFRALEFTGTFVEDGPFVCAFRIFCALALSGSFFRALEFTGTFVEDRPFVCAFRALEAP